MRGKGKPRGRGRGGGGGGGGRSSRGGFGKTNLSRKQITHLQQFGEAHPSEELDNDEFGPSSSKKFKGKFSGGDDRFAPKFRNPIPSSSESDESEEEATPYGELLTLVNGKKTKKVEILSSDEESSEDEEKEDAVESGNSVSDENGSGEDYVTADEKSDDEIDDISAENVDHNPAKQEVDDDEDHNDADDDGPGENVILEEELDPEASDDFGNGGKCVDPFVLHFEQILPDAFVEKIKAGGKLYDVQVKGEYPVLEQYHFLGVSPILECSKEKEVCQLDGYVRSTVEIPGPPVPPKAGGITVDDLNLKSQFKSRIGISNQYCLDQELCKGPITPFQGELLSLFTQYRDVCFPERNFDNAESIRVAYCIHAVNHVMKTRTRILHHNAKLSSKLDVPEEYRDQSFVRPKVLIVLPFRESALRVVKTLISLFFETEKGNVVNKKRFVAEYGGETLFMPKTNPKPEDYMKTFAGNVDDNFRIGISITKKSMKLFSDFYSSDIIIASPLGLRLIIGAEGESGRDYDFLSSIEVVILDQTDIFYMQSWDHVLHLFRHMHLKPVATHGTDFSRIRPWALDDLSKYYCQTLAFSSIHFPELNALFSRYCKNYAGLVKFVNPIGRGSICHVTAQLPQVYQKFPCQSLAETHDSRFQFFLKKILPNFSGKLMSHTLIFVPSYFDFVRIRNHFKREDVSFVQICEYTKDKKIARARDLFFHNLNHFMLYTERAMFFRRLRLKGIGHIIFYQLPQNPQLYSELCNLMQEDYQSKRVKGRKNASVTTIYCKYDAPRLSAVVGSERAKHMLSSDKDVYAFVTGQL